MKKTKQIYDELQKHTAIKKIRKRFNNPKAPLYDALTQYLPEIEQEYQQLVETIETKDAELRALDNECKSRQIEVQKLKKQKDAIQNENNQLQQENQDLEKAKQAKRKTLTKIHNDLSDLKKKGITIALLTKIKDVEVETGEELLTRVKTAEAHVQMKTALGKRQQEKNEVEKEISTLKTEMAALIKDTHNQQNMLDDLKLRTRSIERATKIVTGLFLDGYNTSDLESLRNGLNIIGIKKKPGISIKRLVSGLEKAEGLRQLDQHLNQRERELETLRGNTAQVKGELLAHRETVLATLDETKIAIIKELQEIHIQALSQITRTRKAAVNKIDAIEHKASTSLGNAQSIADKIVEILNRQIDEALSQIDHRITAMMQRLSDDEAAILTRHKTQVDTLRKHAEKVIDTRLKTVTSMIESIIVSITSVRDYAAQTGNAIHRLHALQPTLRLLEAAEGTPSEVLTAMHRLCHQFAMWLDKQSVIDHYFLKSLTNKLIKRLEEEMRG